MSQLLQNAVYGTAMILAVAALRRVLKDRLAPGARLALWAVCLFRLLTPAAPESVLSLWGLGSWFGQTARTAVPQAPAVPVSNGSGTFAPAVSNAAVPAAPAPAETAIPWEAILLGIWLAVGFVLAVRYALSYVRTRRAVGRAIPVGRDDPRYAALPRCARLREGPVDGAPLTFGAARPTVVLSPGLSGEVLECVLAHEGVHAKRRDNLWHYATAAALTVFWWNPAVWLMARLLRRDVELSCDRAVLEKLGAGRRADYANALVSMATQAEGPAFCQTFGRKAAEERIISIMKYKKTTIAGAAVTLALVLAVTVAFASNPAQPDTVEYHGQTYNRADLSQETLDWLDWYCSLSEEGQMSVSMVPPELIPNPLPDGDTEANAGYYYKDGDGKLNPIDPGTVSTAVTVTVNADGTATLDNGSSSMRMPFAWVEGMDGRPGNPILLLGDSAPRDSVELAVDPANLDLSGLDGYLAQKVADNRLTQAEADEALARVQAMMERVRKNGEAVTVLVCRIMPQTVSADPAIAWNSCDLEGCTISGEHHHENGEVVHHYNTLPAELPACSVEGCTETRRHHHSGDHCFLLGDVCPVEGCTICGSHEHDGVVYSCNGAGHRGGVCDGSCYVSFNEGSSTTPSGDDPICELPLAKDPAGGDSPTPTEGEIPVFVPDYDPQVEDSVGDADLWPVCGYPTAEDFANNNTHHSENHHSERHHGSGHH